MKRLVVAMVLAGVLTCGCSSTKQGALEPSVTDTAPTTAPVTSTTSTSTPPTPIGAAIVAAPNGFTPSSDPQAHSGPVDATRLNALFNSTDVATQSHFVSGQEAVYDANKSADSIHIIVLEFATSDEAQQFMQSISIDNTSSQPDPGVPGGEIFDSTTAQADGGWKHVAQGVKGTRVYEISYISDTAAPVPLLGVLSSQQYGRL